MDLKALVGWATNCHIFYRKKYRVRAVTINKCPKSDEKTGFGGYPRLTPQ